jgi:hypothetical protein
MCRIHIAVTGFENGLLAEVPLIRRSSLSGVVYGCQKERKRVTAGVA